MGGSDPPQSILGINAVNELHPQLLSQRAGCNKLFKIRKVFTIPTTK